MVDALKEAIKKYGIVLVPYTDLFQHEAFASGEWDGFRKFTKICGGFANHVEEDGEQCKSIFYDDTQSESNVTRILAHELGHHLLGHLQPGAARGYKSDEKRNEIQESEARLFSVVMVAMNLYDELKRMEVSQ